MSENARTWRCEECGDPCVLSISNKKVATITDPDHCPYGYRNYFWEEVPVQDDWKSIQRQCIHKFEKTDSSCYCLYCGLKDGVCSELNCPVVNKEE